MIRKIGKALVVGAGISGIRAALDLAEFGYGVTLIDRSPHLGGILSQLDYQFPTDRCGMCKMLPLVDRDASSQYCLRKGLFHENIEILLSTEIASVDGEPGQFQVMLKQHPNWVDSDLCIGCGECLSVCPVEVPDEIHELESGAHAEHRRDLAELQIEVDEERLPSGETVQLDAHVGHHGRGARPALR